MTTVERFVIVGILLFACFTSQSLCANYLIDKPSCTEKKSDAIEMKTVKLVGLGPKGRPFPESYGELKGYCRESNKLINEIETYLNTCYKKNIRDMAKVMIYTVKNNIRLFCRKKSKKLNKLLEISSCVNSNFREDESCIFQFMNDTTRLFGMSQDKLKIPLTCCNYAKLMKCIENFLDKFPCARKDREIILDFIRGLSGNMIDVMCGDYNETTNKCSELKVPHIPSVKVKRDYKTFIFVLIDLVESMEDFQR